MGGSGIVEVFCKVVVTQLMEVVVLVIVHGLFDVHAGLLGGVDGETGSADGGIVGGILGFEYYLILAREEDDAFGGTFGVEVADPLQRTIFVGEDAACGGGGEFGEGQLSGKGQLEVGVGPAAHCHIGEYQCGGGEHLDGVGTGKVVGGGVEGLVGEGFALAVLAYQYGIIGDFKLGALVFEV